MVRERTKEQFVKTARMLFAEKGYHLTTMNAIAVLSGKSRRTLYTYFNTKQEIYLEVIKQELQGLYNDLEAFVKRKLSPMDKMMQYIARRQTAINNVVRWNGSLAAEFFNDIATVERARLRFDVLERRLITHILQEGIDKGTFKIIDMKRTVLLLHACMKGLEVPFIRGQLGRTEETIRQTYKVVCNLIGCGLKK